MKKVLYILICVLLLACAEKKPVEVPSTVLPKDKMAMVLVDIHLIEAGMNLNVMSPESAAIPTGMGASIDVLKKHEITKAQYDSSFVFYTQHPEMLKEIYDDVLNELSKLQAKVANE